MKSSSNPFLRTASLAASIVLCLGQAASAGVLTWDGADLSTAGAQGGAGTWDTNTTANWWDGTADVVWPNTGTDNDAVFANTAGTVTVASVTANDLAFNTTGYILSGSSTLTLNGSTPTVTTATGVSTTLGSNTALVLDGTDGFTKAGAGTLTLNGSAVNTFTGGLRVTPGTLALDFTNLSSPTNLINNGNALTLSGGSLSIIGKNVAAATTAQTFNGMNLANGASTLPIAKGASATSATLTLGAVNRSAGGAVTFLPTTAWVTATASTTEIVTVAGITNLNGSLTMPGAGTNAYIGAGFFAGTGIGTRYVQARGSASGPYQLQLMPGTSVFATSGGSATTVYNIGANQNLIGATTNYALIPTSTAAMTLNQATFSYTTNGVLNINTASLTISGGTLTIGAERDLVLNNANTGGLTVNSIIANNGGGASNVTINNAGSGATTLGGANTYTGATHLNAGTLILTGAETAGTSGPMGNQAASAAGTILMTGGTLQFTATNTNDYSGRFSTAGGQSWNINTNAQPVTFATALTGASTLTKSGTGALTLSAANSHSGATSITGTGSLIVSSNDALGSTAGNTTVASGSSLGFSGNVNYASTETIVGSGTGVATALGVISGVQRGFVQSVSGNNTFAGAIQINAAGTSRIGTQDGAQLTLSGPITMASGTTGVTVLFRTGGNNGDFITLSNSGNNWGTTTQIFSGNTDTGAGVKLGVNDALPTALTVNTFSSAGSGTTLDLAGFNQTLAGLTNTSNANLKISNSLAATTSVLTLNTTANRDFGSGGIIQNGAGTIQVVKTGSFDQALQTANTYSGGTLIKNGSITLTNGDDRLLPTGTVTVGDASTSGKLILGSSAFARNQTLAGLLTSGLGGSVVGAHATTDSLLTLNIASGTNSFSGTLGGAGTNENKLALTKSGAGTLDLSGTNTFTGPTTITGGTLALTGSGSIASSLVDVQTGTFDVTATGYTLASAATLRGSGSVTGTVTVATGSAVITAGNGTSGSLSIGNLTFSGTGVMNVGTLSNYTSTAAIDTIGTLTLGGGAGAVTINLPTAVAPNGVYHLLHFGSGIPDVSGFTLGTAPTLGARQSGALTYDGTGNFVDYVISGASAVWTGTQSSEWSINTLTPSKNWALTGGGGPTDYVQGDDVVFDDSATTKTVDISNGNVAPTTISFTSTSGNDYLVQGINGISGSTGLTKSGTGSLTLDTANSYTGATSVSAGMLTLNGSLAGTAISVSGSAVLSESSIGSITGTSSLTLSSSATSTLSGANTHTGATNVNAGTLNLDGSLAATAITVSGSAVLSESASGAITGTASLSHSSSGTSTLSGTNTYIGTTTISAGTVSLVGLLTDTIITVSGTGVLSETSTGIISGAAFLTHSSSGTSTLTGANTYTGLTTVSGGTLELNTTGTNAISGNLTVSGGTARLLQGNQIDDSRNIVVSGGTLDLQGFDDTANGVQLTSGSITGNGSLTSVSTFDVRAGSVSPNLLGSIGLTKTTSGIVTLSGANTYSGDTTLTQGTLRIGASGAIPTGTTKGNVVFSTAGNTTVLDLNGFDISLNGLTASTSTANRVANNAPATAKTLTLGNNDATSTFAGIIVNNSGTGGTLGLNKIGSGTLTLSGSNTFSGGLKLTSGAVTLGNSNAAGSGTVTFDTGGAINATLLLSNGGSPFTIPNAVTVNAGSTGTNTISYSATGTSSGGIGGAIIANENLIIEANVSTVTGSGMTAMVTANPAGTVASGKTITFINSGVGRMTMGASGFDRLSGLGSVAFSGTGTGLIVISGQNTYSGGFTLGGNGTLILAESSIGVPGAPTSGPLGTGTISLGAGKMRATTGVGDYNLQNVVSITGDTTFLTAPSEQNVIFSGPATLTGDRTLTVGTGATVTSKSLTFSGAIGDGGSAYSLTKSGTGTLTLSGANTYTGNTTVNAGTLTLSDDAQLKFVLGASSGSNNTLSGAGTFTLNGDFVIDTTAANALPSGTWTLAPTGTYGSTFTVVGFVDAGGNKWTKANGTTTYTFDEATGILTLAEPGYDSWASANGLDDSDASRASAKNADPDNDGFNNLYEFAFDGNPRSGVSDGKIVTKIATVGGDQVLTLTLPVRGNPTFSTSSGDQLSAPVDSIDYRIEGDVDLATFASSISEVTGGDATTIQTGLPTLTSGWTYRTFRAPGTVTTVPKAFLRAKITETP